MDQQLEQQLRQFKAVMESGISPVEMRALEGRAIAPPPDEVQLEDVDAGGVPADRITPPDATGAVILYVHGGGYVIGSRAGHRNLVSRLALAAGARAVSLDYRLAPEHPFPAAVDDTVAAYRWLLAQGVPAAQIVIGGDSAGGGLALATLVALREAGLPQPAGAVTISAWTDLAATGDSITSRAEIDPLVGIPGLRAMADAYLAGADPQHPLASPLYADLHGLPPLLMQVGTAEVLYDDTIRLAEKARAAGVEVTVETYEGMPHVFPSLVPTAPETLRAVESIGRFVRACTSVTPATA